MRKCEAEDGDDQDSGRSGAGDLSPAPEPTYRGPWLIPPHNPAAVVGQIG